MITSDNAPQFKLVKSTIDALWEDTIANNDAKNFMS
jgi:hypothetical protein